MFKSNNVTTRLFQRQIHCARRFYENIVPSYTIYDVECPDHSFRKFTDDGLYLVSFSRNHQDVVVYRPKWLTFSCKEKDCDTHDLPLKARKFESFFTQLYSVTLASSGELICKDFFLYMESNQFGLFATSTAQIHDVPPTGGATQGVPSVEKITFHLLRLEDGAILGERVFHNDYVNLAHSVGAFLYDDLLAIVSLRYQRIHILQIRDSGDIVDVRAIGEFCREDDELFLNSNSQSLLHQVLVDHVGNGFHHSLPESETFFLSGIKQRLLSFIFRGIWNEETDQTMLELHWLRFGTKVKVFQDHLKIKANVVDVKKSSKEDAKAKEEWEKVDARLCTLLWRSIDSKLMPQFRPLQTCYLVYEKAHALYTNDIYNFYDVISRMTNLKKQESDMSTHLEQVQAVMEEFETLMPVTADVEKQQEYKLCF
ncbi:Light-mediated development protein DET1 [Capsicum baccatum]|uniref:Light-mediated development protein DET1 n=1 Tax=Capsicum baccatum TaxID=33114 RepID=A0A2G2XPQ6_CAPBA|nr:Light-mediated development protein DET1 [Capsicum baccatum]